MRPKTGMRLRQRSEEHTSELQSPQNIVCRLLLEKNKIPHNWAFPKEVSMAIRFIVNGKPQSVDVSPGMPLLWVLRDTLVFLRNTSPPGMALFPARTVLLN